MTSGQSPALPFERRGVLFSVEEANDRLLLHRPAPLPTPLPISNRRLGRASLIKGALAAVSRRSTSSSNGKCRRGEKGCLESVVYPAGDRGFEPPSSGKESVSSRGFARLCLRAADRGEPHAARRDGQGCRTAGTDRQGIRLRKESGSAFKAERIFGQAEFRWVSGRSLVKTYEAVSSGMSLGAAIMPEPYGMLIDDGRPDLVLVDVAALLLSRLLCAGGACVAFARATAPVAAE